MDAAMNRAGDDVFLLILVPPTTNIALENNNLKPKPQTETESSPFPTFFLQWLLLLVLRECKLGEKVEPKSYQKFSNDFSHWNQGKSQRFANVFCSLPWCITIWIEEDFRLLPEQLQVIMYTVYCTVIPY